MDKRTPVRTSDHESGSWSSPRRFPACTRMAARTSTIISSGGFTERTRDDRGAFYFESQVKRPFYVAGRADDPSKGVQDATIGFMREGCWYLDNGFKIGNADAIRYVRGRFQGWGLH